MTPIIIYLLKVSICTCLFYWSYYGLLSKLNHYQLNRLYLMSCLTLSFIIPLIPYNWNSSETSKTVLQEFVQPTRQLSQSVEQEFVYTPLQITPVSSSTLTIADCLLIIYVALVVAFLFQYLVSLWKLFRTIQEAKIVDFNGTKVRQHSLIPSSSFFHFLFFQGEYHKKHTNWIITHETAHAKEFHSLDLVILNLSVIFLWFNPFLRLYRRELQLLHEYLADQRVLRQGADRNEYAQFLISLIPDRIDSPHSHNFASNTKKRIERLFAEASTDWSLLRYLSMGPVLGVVILLFSANTGFDLKGSIQNILGSSAMLFDQSNALAKQNYFKLQWGDEFVDLNFEPIAYAQPAIIKIKPKLCHIHVEKSTLDRIFNNNPCIIDYNGNATPLESLETKLYSQGSSGNYTEIKSVAQRIQDNDRLTIEFVLDSISHLLSFRVNDPEGSKTYLKVNGKQYKVGYHNQNWPIQAPLNVVTASELIQILQHPSNITNEGRSFGVDWNQTEFSIYSSPMVLLNWNALKAKLLKENKITYPIRATINSGSDRFLIAFDDDPFPDIKFKTWEEELSHPRRSIIGIRHLVREKVKIQWSTMKLDLKANIYCYKREVNWNGKKIDLERQPGGTSGMNVPMTDMITMLKSSPRWRSSVNKNWNKIHIHIRYIDHVGIPTRNILTYHRSGRLMEGEEWLQNVLQRLKPGDFFQFSFSDGDGLLIPGFMVKLIE